MILKEIKKHLVSPFVILSILCFVLGGFFLMSPQKKVSQKLLTKTALITENPTLTKTQPTPATTVLISAENEKPTIIPTSVPTQIQQNNNTQPTQTPVPTQNAIFTLQLNEPDGNFSYPLPFHNGSNPCSILNDAKSKGNIKSVTIMHYGAPLNSDYVKEINGYSDNWNYSINGQSMPKGCSNYTLSTSDTVLWKFN